jgi:hypothetical protein
MISEAEQRSLTNQRLEDSAAMDSNLQLQVNDQYFDSERLNHERRRLEEEFGLGSVFTDQEFGERFEMVLVMPPMCVVRDKLTGKLGGMFFRDRPRLYFGYEPD